MTTTREIERKYAPAAGASLPDLTAVSGVATVSDPVTFTLEATYFDTPGLRLAANRVTLRRRIGGADEGWHLKLPAGGARDEIHASLEGPATGPPAELAGLVHAFTRGEALTPVGRIVTHRTRRLLSGPDGEPLAEAVFDDVSAQTLGAETTVTSWTEAEVELAGGDESLLDSIESCLAEAGIERSESPSKLAHLLGDRLPAAADLAGEGSTAGEAGLGYLREQLATLLEYDPRVRLDEEDAVHKMRVATRRSRSALKTFAPVLGTHEALGEELRWLGGELGAVRDLDVLPVTLEASLGPLPDELIVGPVRARIHSRTSQDRARARENLLASLASDRYFAVLAAFEALVATSPDVEGPPLDKLVTKSYKRVAKRMAVALDEPPGTAKDEAIHETRKAVKRARYAGEAAAPVLGKPAKKFVDRMQDLQEILGAHQDSVVARGVLRTLGMQAFLAGENSFTYGLLYGLAAGRASATERELPAEWDRLGDPPF
jgi:CHAD domain-containing protein